MKLGKLDPVIYSEFIVSMFGKYKKEISPEIAMEILEWSNTHTFYVQQLCNRVFSTTKIKVTSESWKQQAYLLLKEQEPVFFVYRSMLSKSQWQLLKALADEGFVYQPTSGKFLDKYRLGTSATVLRSLAALQNYELVYKNFDQEGAPFYSVYDLFLQRWVGS